MRTGATLEQMMLLLGMRVGEDDGLTDRVRSGLLGLLLERRLPHGLSPKEASVLVAWAESVRRAGGTGLDEIYQELLRREVFRGEGGVELRLRPDHHRRSGAYYTAETVVRYMVERAVEYASGASAIIDPACGTGAFLHAVDERLGSSLERLSGWDLDPEAIALCRGRVPRAELSVQDALLAESVGGYDLCLGNPPYIGSGLRGAPSPDPARSLALRTRYRHAAAYKLNTYPLFVERGLELLRPGGVLGYILPDSWLTGRFFAGLRRLLLQQTLLELTLIRQDFWRYGRVGQSVILFVRRGAGGPNQHVRVRICEGPEDLEGGLVQDLPLQELIWGAEQRFRLVPSPSQRAILRRMEAGSRPLRYWLGSYSGLIGRRGQASLILPPALQPGADSSAKRLLRSGKEIDRYRLEWEGHWVRLDPELIKSGGNRAYYERPKLLLRQTADALRAVYDDQGYYCLNNTHLLVPARSETNLRALLGLINSAVFGDYYRSVSMEAGRLYAQVDLDMLGSLPAPDLSSAAIAELERLVRQRESATPVEVAPLEEQIDRVVRKAYRLS